jgi:hypothetical protein
LQGGGQDGRDAWPVSHSGSARNDSLPPRNAGLASLMKNGRFPGNRIAALRHFQPLCFFNFGML